MSKPSAKPKILDSEELTDGIQIKSNRVGDFRQIFSGYLNAVCFTGLKKIFKCKKVSIIIWEI